MIINRRKYYIFYLSVVLGGWGGEGGTLMSGVEQIEDE